MKNKMVSVIITTKNRSEILKTAINSVINQTYKNLEIIIVDDGSTDDTREICEKYALADSRVKYKKIEYKNLKGGNHTRNVGILEAKGEYIAFLDDDDEWFLNKIQKQVEYINTNPEYSLVSTNFINKYIFENKIYSYKSHVKPASKLNHYMIGGSVSITSTILVKRAALIDIGMFNEDLKAFQEVEMSYRIREKYKVGFIEDHLIIYNHYCSKEANPISNNVDKYLNSIEYVNKKYQYILEKLDKDTLQRRQYSIYWDCIERCLRGNNNKEARKYMIKAIAISKNLKVFVLYIASFILNFQNIILIKSLNNN